MESVSLRLSHLLYILVNAVRRHDLILDSIQTGFQKDCQGEIRICRRIRAPQLDPGILSAAGWYTDQRSSRLA